MKLLIKILYWAGILIAVFVVMSLDSATVSSQNLEKLPTIKNPVADQPDGLNTEFLIKTGITVLILIVGYIASLGISSVIKKFEASSLVEKQLHEAVVKLTGEMKFQRQKNNQYEIDIAILKKRQNRIENKTNHQQIELEKIKAHGKD